MPRALPWKPIAIVTTAIAILLLLLLLPACCCLRKGMPAVKLPEPPPSRIPEIGSQDIPTPTEAQAKAPTEAMMRNVDFHIDATTVMHIHSLRGQFVAKAAGKPVNFDNKTEFVVKIDRARIGMDSAGLDQLMNRYVFGYEGAPLRNLHVVPEGGQLVQSGIMHKGVDIPFTMYGDVSATPDGRIRIHPTKLEICSINGLGLLKALGLSMEKMLDLSKAKGVVAEQNDLLLEPTKILPPPQIDAHLAEVHVEGSELVQVFDAGMHLPDLAPPYPNEKNVMYYRHGTLRMGKLLMIDADMEVTDTDPRDPFDFFIDRYNDQLVAGFEHNTPVYGLMVFMRDYVDLGLPLQPGERSAPKQ
ncbi:MAG TPA: hypothetical protein VI670_07555 [Thermoanaerobaculia bacterium]|jgi:hypothetical protein